MSADPQSFPDSFCRLTSYPPMRWQNRLFDQLIDGKFPSAIDLPTGLGKTSVMAIWLVARALAGEGLRKAIPRRLVYIVDRRAVVDQATEEAERLRQALNRDAAHLKIPLGLSSGTLPISTLRGAHLDNREWLDDPTAPAIVVGTIDMIGSRLLFEGYGVSRKMRTYHAGLLGADTLIVLDEAHLVPPFEALLWQIANGAERFGSCAESDTGVVPGFKLLPLSATGRTQPASDRGAARSAFRLEDEDLADPIVRGRLSAKKTVGFVNIDSDKFAEELARQAWKLSEEGGKRIRSLIYCDSREVAEKVKAGLDKLSAPDKKRAEPKADTELFVGARRVEEREDAKAWLENHGFLAGLPPPAKLAFLIATSAGEVGIDLDADHMVCDLVPWERMVQRLGRVNRRGQGDAAIIVVHGDEPKPKNPDAPTDQEFRQSIAFRSLSVLNELPNVGTGRDASPGALRELKLRAETDKALGKKIDEATTPAPMHPALTRALVDAWSMTSLEDHTGRPDVAPWLRGWVEEEPQTTVIWRQYLPVRTGEDGEPVRASKKEIEDFFEAAPPHESEKLETETRRVVEWLMARAKSLLKDLLGTAEGAGTANLGPEADADDVMPTVDAATTIALKPLRRDDIAGYVLSPAGDYEGRYTLRELTDDRNKKLKEVLLTSLRGKALVVDVRLAGLKDGLFDKDEENVPHAADGGDTWIESDGKPIVGFRIRLEPRQAASGDDALRESYRFEIKRSEGEDATSSIVIEGLNEERRAESRHPQLLTEHQSWAEQKAGDIASKIDLSGPAFDVLTLAARLHDEGKRAEKWQNAFNAKRDAARCGLTGPLAKTTGFRPNLLDGYRHEFGSLAVFETHHPWAEALPVDIRQRLEALRPSSEWFDLLQHLVASHHGGARPVISTDGCQDGPPSALKERACEVALRFARLQKRWGPWGLAWWEALLRAADQQASRDNDRGEGLASHGEGR